MYCHVKCLGILRAMRITKLSISIQSNGKTIYVICLFVCVSLQHLMLFLYLSIWSPYVRTPIWISAVYCIYGSDFIYHCRKNHTCLATCLNIHQVYRKICNMKQVATVISIYIVLCLWQLLSSTNIDLM